jgi:hypothetical protein
MGGLALRLLGSTAMLLVGVATTNLKEPWGPLAFAAAFVAFVLFTTFGELRN